MEIVNTKPRWSDMMEEEEIQWGTLNAPEENKDVKKEPKECPIEYLQSRPLDRKGKPLNLCNKVNCPSEECCMNKSVKGLVKCDRWHKMKRGYARVKSKYVEGQQYSVKSSNH